MDILIVGAGAVGQVYGRLLAQAGHKVTFFVKPKYAAETAAGMPLHWLGFLRTRSETWRDYAVVSDLDAAAARRWDQVWLAFASDALRSPLATDLLARVGDATLVCLQPGPEDAAYVRTKLRNPAQLVQGLITFISFQSPLPGREGPAGIACFLPPLTPTPFGGSDRARVDGVVQALRDGGLSAKRVADVESASGGPEAVTIPLIAALEQHDWKLAGFGGSPQVALARAASHEALAILARERGQSFGMQKLALTAPVTRTLLALAPLVIPLPLETYLKYHFSKVGVQTRQVLETYIAMGQRHSLPVTALTQLRAALPVI